MGVLLRCSFLIFLLLLFQFHFGGFHIFGCRLVPKPSGISFFEIPHAIMSCLLFFPTDECPIAFFQ